MKDLDEIVDLFLERRKRLTPVHAAIRDFNAFLRDEKPVPLPELDRTEQSGIANLAAVGLEQLSERAGSVVPDEHWPSTEPGEQEADRRARTRRRASLGWSERNAMDEVLTLRASYLLAHATGPVTVMPDTKTGVPQWLVRDPLTVFSAPCANPLEVQPPDTHIANMQTWQWLTKRYGETVPALQSLRRSQTPGVDDRFIHLQYIDDEQITNIVLSDIDGYGVGQGARAVLLDSTPNLAQCPLLFDPRLVSAAGQRGQFAGTVGIHQMRAKIAALAYITASKGASPDVYLEKAGPNDPDPEVIAQYDPRTGAPGVVDGRIRTIDVNPSNTSLAVMSVLAGELRHAGGIPAALTGEAPSTVQTGKMSAALLANAIDFVVQKVHRKFARSLTLEKQAAVAIVKAWTPGRRSFYVGWHGARGKVDYDPKTDFDSSDVVVSYPLAGADLNNLLTRAQGKRATGMWSLRTALEKDPETEDAAEEMDRLALEQIDAAVLSRLLARVDDPNAGVTLEDLVAFGDSIAKPDVTVREAAKTLIEALKERQAAPPEEGTPDAMAGAEPVVEPEPEGPPGLSATSAILAQMRSVGRGVAA